MILGQYFTILCLFMYPRNRGALACRYLFSCVVSDEKATPAPEKAEDIFANIGAFKVSDITKKYVNNLFESLLIPWDSEVKPEDLESISAVIKKYYSPEQYEFFCNAVDCQKRIKVVKNSLRTSLKIFLHSWQPKVYYWLKHLRRG